MKKIQVIHEEGRITFHWEAEERMTKEQRYNVIIALIVCVTICVVGQAFFSLFM